MYGSGAMTTVAQPIVSTMEPRRLVSNLLRHDLVCFMTFFVPLDECCDSRLRLDCSFSRLCEPDDENDDHAKEQKSEYAYT